MADDDTTPEPTRGFVLNPDGSATFETAAGSGQSRSIRLPEPSMEQLAQVFAVYDEAEQALPDLPDLIQVDAGATPKQIADAQARLREYQQVSADRARLMYGPDSPHAKALTKMVEVMTGETLTMADLPAWAGNPLESTRLLRHFTTPFRGAVPLM